MGQNTCMYGTSGNHGASDSPCHAMTHPPKETEAQTNAKVLPRLISSLRSLHTNGNLTYIFPLLSSPSIFSRDSNRNQTSRDLMPFPFPSSTDGNYLALRFPPLRSRGVTTHLLGLRTFLVLYPPLACIESQDIGL